MKSHRATCEEPEIKKQNAETSIRAEPTEARAITFKQKIVVGLIITFLCVHKVSKGPWRQVAVSWINVLVGGQGLVRAKTGQSLYVFYNSNPAPCLSRFGRGSLAKGQPIVGPRP